LPAVAAFPTRRSSDLRNSSLETLRPAGALVVRLSIIVSLGIEVGANSRHSSLLTCRFEPVLACSHDERARTLCIDAFDLEQIVRSEEHTSELQSRENL